MLSDLDREDRLRLLRFVCSFAWADLEVREAERTFLKNLLRRLGLEHDDAATVDAWLQVPPRAEDVDPFDIPHAHRRVFLEVMAEMVEADGDVDEAEVENYLLLKQLLHLDGEELDEEEE